MSKCAIILAGGKGTRMKSEQPKVMCEVLFEPMIYYVVSAVKEAGADDICVITGYRHEVVEEYLAGLDGRIQTVLQSPQLGTGHAVMQARAFIEQHLDDDILILNGDGPLMDKETIQNSFDYHKENGNAITCTPCFETILMSTNGTTVEQVPYRKDTYAAQAPQSFMLGEIIADHEKIRATPERYENLVDSCTLIKKLGKEAHMVEGNRGNIKVTTPEDVYMYRALIQYRENEQAFGIGATPDILKFK